MLSKGIGRYYKVSEDGENLIRTKKFCPRCGPGTFMAEMYDRIVCGHCGFTEFKKKPIKTGLSNNDYITIEDGLKEGDKVSLIDLSAGETD